MLTYVSVGVDDMDKARRFYMSFMPTLGYGMTESHEGLSFVLPPPPEAANDPSKLPPEFYVKPPFDGKPASSGNGTMIAFEARNQQQVREVHAAGLAAGGSDEGGPGFRDAYGPRFYVAYFRDPQGNKFAIYSSSPTEPGRDD